MTVQASAPTIVGVRFREVGKLYHFESTGFPDVRLGDYVIVETARGRQLGQVMGLIPPEKVDLPNLKSIKRPANARDLLMKKLYEAKDVEALIVCREQAQKMGGFDAVKFVQANYNYDGSVLAFLYTSEDPVNTHRLRAQLAKEFRCRIDMRRIGARDAAKLLGEYGACGSPRCCSTHLTDFSPISIKMAKAQGISLNPSEITGMCGRLRCCLIYEYEQYVEAKKHLPRRNKTVGTPHGEGKVIDLLPLKDTVVVWVEGNRYEVHRDDIIPLEELRALQEKSGQGCAKEGGGVCDCGARIRPGKEATASHEEPDKPEADTTADSQPRGRKRSKRGHDRGSRRRH